jgi:hypothetical protein
MNIAIFITIWTAAVSTNEVSDYIHGEPLKMLKTTASVDVVEVYTPAKGELPAFNDSGIPALMIEVNTDSIEKAKALVYSDEFKKLLTNRRTYPFAVDRINVEITEVVNYKIPGLDKQPQRKAPLSFVVRYYGPVSNQAEYVEMYTDSHPRILSQFPGIRNVLCYLPIGWQKPGEVTDSRMIIGNEVVFDNLPALNKALASPVLEMVLEDGRRLAKINIGDGTHHAMDRKLVYKRAGDK